MLIYLKTAVIFSLALFQLIFLPNISLAKTPIGMDTGVLTAEAGPDDLIYSADFENTPQPVEITSFTVLPGSITEGESIELTWQVKYAAECTPANGTDGWDSTLITLPGGSVQLDITSAGSFDFTLTCLGEIDQASSTRTVEVDALPSTCNVTLTDRTVKTWFSVFGVSWPGPTYNETRVRIPMFGYYAVAFNTGDVVDSGALSNFEASGTHGIRLAAISETPGCFDVVDECKETWSTRSGIIVWETDGQPGGCPLKPNTSYYWNVTFTDGSDPDSSSCIGSFCETFLTVANPE